MGKIESDCGYQQRDNEGGSSREEDRLIFTMASGRGDLRVHQRTAVKLLQMNGLVTGAVPRVLLRIENGFALSHAL